jgi:hypothetical protein
MQGKGEGTGTRYGGGRAPIGTSLSELPSTISNLLIEKLTRSFHSPSPNASQDVIPVTVGGTHMIRVVFTVFMVVLPGLLIRGTVRDAR